LFSIDKRERLAPQATRLPTFDRFANRRCSNNSQPNVNQKTSIRSKRASGKRVEEILLLTLQERVAVFFKFVPQNAEVT